MNEIVHNRLEIERYFVDELGPHSKAEIETHLNNCSVCTSYLEKIKAEKKQFLREHPFNEFAATAFPLNSSRRIVSFDSIRRIPVLASGYAALIITIFTVYFVVYRLYGPSKSEITYKTGTGISFLCRRDGVIKQGNVDDTFYAGDEIQILYSSPRKQYLGVFSIDSKGLVSFYNTAEDTSCSVVIEPGASKYYPASIVLDEEKGWELIIALFSEKPLSCDSVSMWLNKTFTLSQNRYSIEKILKKLPIGPNGVIQTLNLTKG